MDTMYQKELNSWKKICILNPHNLSEKEISELPVYFGTRTVILVDDDKVVLIKSTKSNYYVLVGGSIEEGETIEQGLIRECKEESGYDISIISPLGYIELCKKKYKRIIFGFLVKAVGEPTELLLTEEEKELGHTVYICPMDEAITLLKNDVKKGVFVKDNLAAIRSLMFLEEAEKYLKKC